MRDGRKVCNQGRVRFVGAATAVVVLVTVVVLGGCGANDAREASGRASTAGESAAMPERDVDRDAALDALEQALDEQGRTRMESCEAVADAMFFVGDYELKKRYLQDDPVWPEWEAQLDSVLQAVPPDLRDEIDVFQTAAAAHAATTAGLSSDDLLDPKVQRGVDAARRELETPEVRRASDTIDAYFAECRLR